MGFNSQLGLARRRPQNVGSQSRLFSILGVTRSTFPDAYTTKQGSSAQSRSESLRAGGDDSDVCSTRSCSAHKQQSEGGVFVLGQCPLSAITPSAFSRHRALVSMKPPWSLTAAPRRAGRTSSARVVPQSRAPTENSSAPDHCPLPDCHRPSAGCQAERRSSFPPYWGSVHQHR